MLFKTVLTGYVPYPVQICAVGVWQSAVVVWGDPWVA